MGLSALDPDSVAVPVGRGTHKGKGLEARVLNIDIVFGTENNGMSGRAEQQAIKGSVAGDEGSGEAVVSHRNVGTSHGGDTAEGERKSTHDVDQRVHKKGRVVVELDSSVIRAVFFCGLLGLSSQRYVYGDVENTGCDERKENKKVMSE